MSYGVSIFFRFGPTLTRVLLSFQDVQLHMHGKMLYGFRVVANRLRITIEYVFIDV